MLTDESIGHPFGRDRRAGRAALLVQVALFATACSPAPDREDWAGRVLPEPVERPDFVLADTEGEPYDFRSETEGKVALLFFGYTNCPDVCPVHMANLAAVLRDLPPRISRQIEVVFVTTDPERDTPERLRAWLDGHDRDFVGLRGSVDEIHAIERELGLPPSVVEEQAGETFVGHAGQVLAFGAPGPARLAFPFGTRQRDLHADLPRLVRGERPDRESDRAGAPAGDPVDDPSDHPEDDPTGHPPGDPTGHSGGDPARHPTGSSASDSTGG